MLYSARLGLVEDWRAESLRVAAARVHDGPAVPPTCHVSPARQHLRQPIGQTQYGRNARDSIYARFCLLTHRRVIDSLL